ncbi:MAG: carbohydrate kinase [Solirubrobacterales bacterium]|nr:carbohydrate kinase [Solirubrobacterales bacterium]
MLVVAGESLVDLLVDEAGDVTARPGGAPFNVARGLARLGARCAFLGAVSTDPFGALLRRTLEADGVDLACVVAKDLSTLLAVAHLEDGVATYRFHVAGTAAPALTEADVAAVLPPRMEVLHVGGLGLALEPMAGALAGLVASASPQTLVSVDPNCRPDAIADHAAYRARLGAVLAGADVVKVSTEDLDYLAPGVPAARAARELLAGRVRCVLVTDGGRPLRIVAPQAEHEVPVVPAAVVDTVGAGDALCAGFLAWWAREGLGAADLASPTRVEDAAAFAVRVAAATCERSGAEPPTLAELDALAG